MALYRVAQTGAEGLNKDYSEHELPPNIWTDLNNIRFRDGFLERAPGYLKIYGTPPEIPQYIQYVLAEGQKWWIVASATKVNILTTTVGVNQTVDITHITPRTGIPNKWTGTSFSGIPILNAADGLPPMAWDLVSANKFVDLPNWPANTSCKAFRSYRNLLIAMNVTKGGVVFPYMVKWSDPADPGTVPVSWDQTNPIFDAGEIDLAVGQDFIVDGLELRDSFIVYKELSTWRLDYSGNTLIFNANRIYGTNGALNRNCIVEIDGKHVVLSSSDIVIHDGQSGQSILDKQTRYWFYNRINTVARDKCFLMKNPFYKEVYICFPSASSVIPNSAIVYNYEDGTVSVRDLPNINHGAFGQIGSGMGNTWAAGIGSWQSQIGAWNSSNAGAIDTAALYASALGTPTGTLYHLDVSNQYDGAIPASLFAERRGLSFGSPEKIHCVKSLKARIEGEAGGTVTVKVGAAPDPYSEPVYSATIPYVIGATVNNDCYVTGRYIAVRFENSGAQNWHLDSYDLDVMDVGFW